MRAAATRRIPCLGPVKLLNGVLESPSALAVAGERVRVTIAHISNSRDVQSCAPEYWLVCPQTQMGKICCGVSPKVENRAKNQSKRVYFAFEGRLETTHDALPTGNTEACSVVPDGVSPEVGKADPAGSR